MRDYTVYGYGFSVDSSFHWLVWFSDSEI